MVLKTALASRSRGPKSSGCCCWHLLRCWAQTGEAESEHEANKRVRRWKHVPTRPLLFWSVSSSLSNRSPLPGVSSALTFAFPLPTVCRNAAALGDQWFFQRQQLLPSLSLHIQDVSFRKHELIPRLTPVCFHSASVSTLLPTSYVEAAEIERKKYKLY